MTASETASQAGQFTESSTKEKPKKGIIAGLVFVGVLYYLIKSFGICGIAFVAGFAACGWLIFRTVKGKPKIVPAVVTIILLTIALAVPGENTASITQKQLMKNLSDVMQPVGYQLVATDTMSDNAYLIYVKDRPNDTPRPNGIQCKIEEENSHVKSIILTSASGSKGIPMSAMKFVSALNPKWSSDKVTAVMTKILKGENVQENGIIYTFEDYETSSQFLIKLK
ncbi:hypothetical protein [Anaerovorax odorimutans]|uniref:hypothetical protein n=1 Tax=Anaerovorax odorimutans TaxID=109327 RepID=UPI0012EBB9EC|nr:hypothetical protein [Anaerovorax odorimutans]